MRDAGLSSTNVNGGEVDWVVDVMFIRLILSVELVMYSTFTMPSPYPKVVESATSTIRVAHITSLESIDIKISSLPKYVEQTRGVIKDNSAYSLNNETNLILLAANIITSNSNRSISLSLIAIFGYKELQL